MRGVGLLFLIGGVEIKTSKLITCIDLLGDASYVSIGLVLILSILSSASAQQLPSQDPGHKQDAEIAGVKFSVPKGFNLEKSSNSSSAFMRHEKYDLALFVAVPNAQIDDRYLTDLSNSLASQLLPQEKGFEWKMLPNRPDRKVSKYQIGSGNTKGFNEIKFVQTDYIIVKVEGHDVLVGYITKFEPDRDAKFLFNLKGVGGLSMPGWYAQAHIIASVTGEKYEQINPGTVIIGTPVKKNN